MSSRKYSPIWKAIKAAEINKPVIVKVHRSHVATLIQGVRKEKSREVAFRRSIGEPAQGTLEATVSDCSDSSAHQFIKFELAWDMTKLV